MYLKLNKMAYEELAPEFESKIKIRLINTRKALTFFLENFNKNAGVEILELGPGSGLFSKLLTEKNFSVTALEFSPKMAEICKKISPRAEIIVDEFLRHNFRKRKFSGIIALAFVHLFPKKISGKVLLKIRKLLKKKGVALVSTTIHNKSEEGCYVKKNFTKKIERFRRRFTREELEREFLKSGFKIIAQRDVADREEKGKVWMDYIVTLH